MNIPILVVAIIMTLAVIAHAVGGTRETASLEPVGQSGKPMAVWVQTMSAFQMLTVDLIILTALLYVLALTDLIPHARMVARCVAGYFALQTVIWMGHVLWLRRDGATLLSVPHWAVWCLCTGLMWIGS